MEFMNSSLALQHEAVASTHTSSHSSLPLPFTSLPGPTYLNDGKRALGRLKRIILKLTHGSRLTGRFSHKCEFGHAKVVKVETIWSTWNVAQVWLETMDASWSRLQGQCSSFWKHQ